jgi:hypothetical protein
MSDAISAIGSAAVGTVGTLAVTGMALKAVGSATKNMNNSGSRRSSRKKSSGRRPKSYSVWN